MQSIDRALERIYERLGWRIVLAYQAFAYVSIFLLGGGLFARLIRVNRLSTSDWLAVAAVLIPVWICTGVPSTIGIVRSIRPVTTWLESDRRETGAEAAWETALRL